MNERLERSNRKIELVSVAMRLKDDFPLSWRSELETYNASRMVPPFSLEELYEIMQAVRRDEPRPLSAMAEKLMPRRSTEKHRNSPQGASDEGDDMTLDRLKNFVPRGGIQLEDAMLLAAQARQLAAEYDLLKVDKPDFLDEKIDQVRRFVSESQRDLRRKKLANLRARHDALKTPSERRTELEAEIKELEASA